MCVLESSLNSFFFIFFRNTVLEPLAFAPTPTLVTLLNDFVQNHVFVDDEDEEKDDHSKIQELHKRRNFLASFSKLIIYNVLPTKHGADVFKHYVVFYNHYGKNLTKSLKVIEILIIQLDSFKAKIKFDVNISQWIFLSFHFLVDL